AGAHAKDYYGIRIGSFCDEARGIQGDVWLVNKTALQITNWKLRSGDGRQVRNFYFSTEETIARAERLFKVISTPSGDYSKPM
ncbi:hypothetical protein Tcan_00438, partial [Toxocara canis]